MTGDCSVCGPEIRVKKSYKPTGKQKQHYRCHHKYEVTKRHIETPWLFHKKEYCEDCNFFPEHECQLTVDHIDGDKYNNEISNYRTLCHNCHALKTLKNGDYSNRYSDRQQSL